MPFLNISYLLEPTGLNFPEQCNYFRTHVISFGVYAYGLVPSGLSVFCHMLWDLRHDMYTSAPVLSTLSVLWHFIHTIASSMHLLPKDIGIPLLHDWKPGGHMLHRWSMEANCCGMDTAAPSVVAAGTTLLFCSFSRAYQSKERKCPPITTTM